MKWALYNLLFAFVFPFLLPGFLLRMARRGGYRARMGDRFALYPPEVIARLAEGGFVWVHAVSVGEVQVAGQLMREWRKAESGVKFLFSTTSSTGWKTAERELGENDILVYNPLDFPTFVTAALRTARPRAIVLTESEIWPVFIRSAKKRNIPLFLVNARVSDRSAPRYAKAKFFFKDIFSSFAKIFAQSELDKARLLAAGAPEAIVEVTGSFKFDVARRNSAKEAELREWASLAGRKLILGGSTWPGEDKVLLEIFKSLPAGKAALALAPRHFEKADAVEANIKAAGFGCVRRSRGEKGGGANSVFLADTTGELMGLYGIADCVFVGKSLCEHGSQNMIEPCLCGKPTAVGPYTENFRPVMSDLLEGGGIVQVKDARELGETIRGWLENGDGGLGERAKAAVCRRTGVVPKCVAAIRGALAALALAAIPAFASHDMPKFPAIRVVGAFITLSERPSAAKVYLADDEAEKYAYVYKVAKRTCADAKTAKEGVVYDIVLAGTPPEDWSALTARLSERGVLALALDARKMTAAKFKEVLEAFPAKETRFWMIGASDWLLTGRMNGAKLKMDSLMELFVQNDGLVWEEAEKAGCGSVQELLANYAGTREEILPALAVGDLTAQIAPQYLLPVDVPDLKWIDPAGVDPDIVMSLAEGINRMQAVRRRVVEGMVAVAKGDIEGAVKCWIEAFESNPRDTMLLERLYTLIVNARAFSNFGKIAEAAQCYDICFAVNPGDLRVAEEYASLLRTLKRDEDAAKVEDYVKKTRLAALKRDADQIERIKEDIRKSKGKGE